MLRPSTGEGATSSWRGGGRRCGHRLLLLLQLGLLQLGLLQLGLLQLRRLQLGLLQLPLGRRLHLAIRLST